MPGSLDERPYFLSTTIPGEPFSFTDWDSYLEEYRSSYFALSTRKGGWDTFRHLEVLFSGAIPLMPRLKAASPFSLAHFPKRALVEVLRSLEDSGLAVPGARTREFFRDFSLAHLTSEASAHYVRTVTGLEDKRVLFLDQSLPTRTDYLSAFVLIGLLRTGPTEIVYEPSYLFDDFRGETAALYGRGFGYSRSVPAALRDSRSVSAESSIKDVKERCEAVDAIVVGSYDNNREIVEKLVRMGIPESRFVCVVGSDLTSDFVLRSHMRSSAMTFFVREFA